MKFDTEIKVIPLKNPFANQVVFHDRFKPSIVAQYAIELCKTGMHMGYEDKKMNKLRMTPPQQVVKRACDLAESLFAEMDARGWIKEVPPMSEIQGDDPTKVGF